MAAIRFSLAGLLLLAACSSEPAPAPSPSACVEQRFEGSGFVVCDPAGGRLRLFAAGRDEQPVRRFADLPVEPATVAFAMNAGMFDEAGRPIGLAVADGLEKHRINRREGGGNFHLMPNGVFLVRRDGRAEVVTSERFTPSADIDLATQSGPMLVIGGRLHPKLSNDGPSRHVRNGVGVRAGRALFVITQEPVSMGKLARFFRDRLNTPDALYFDGSVSSLWDPAAGRMDAFTELGPMVVAFRPPPGNR